MQKQVIVLGMHRSGSSMVSSLCHGLGVNMGLKLPNGLEDNPFGYEDEDFLNLNKRILKACDSSWDFPPDTELISQSEYMYRKEIQDLIFSRHGLWGWKDPRTCFTLPLYIDYLDNPYFIRCYRNERDMAYSLFKKYQIPIWAGLKLSRLYEERLNSFFSSNVDIKSIAVDYKKLRSDPIIVAKDINDFLDLKLDDSQLFSVASLTEEDGAVSSAKEETMGVKGLLRPDDILKKIRGLYKKLLIITGWKYRKL